MSRARKQLNNDHYGVDKVKKQLLEYLAVLKLKQFVNCEVDAQVVKAEEKNAIKKLEVFRSKRIIDKSLILYLLNL